MNQNLPFETPLAALKHGVFEATLPAVLFEIYKLLLYHRRYADNSLHFGIAAGIHRICFSAPIISTSLCFLFAMPPPSPQNAKIIYTSARNMGSRSEFGERAS